MRQAERRVAPGGRAGVRPPPGVSSVAKANAHRVQAPQQLAPSYQMTDRGVGPASQASPLRPSLGTLLLACEGAARPGSRALRAQGRPG